MTRPLFSIGTGFRGPFLSLRAPLAPEGEPGWRRRDLLAAVHYAAAEVLIAMPEGADWSVDVDTTLRHGAAHVWVRPFGDNADAHALLRRLWPDALEAP